VSEPIWTACVRMSVEREHINKRRHSMFVLDTCAYLAWFWLVLVQAHLFQHFSYGAVQGSSIYVYVYVYVYIYTYTYMYMYTLMEPYRVVALGAKTFVVFSKKKCLLYFLV